MLFGRNGLGVGSWLFRRSSFFGGVGGGGAVACSRVFASSGVFGSCIIVSGAGGSSGAGASVVSSIAVGSYFGTTGSKYTDILFYVYTKHKPEVLQRA